MWPSERAACFLRVEEGVELGEEGQDDLVAEGTEGERADVDWVWGVREVGRHVHGAFAVLTGW